MTYDMDILNDEQLLFSYARRAGYTGRSMQLLYKMLNKKKMEKKKKILYIDMDGVIADFAKAINNINPDLDMSEDTESYEDRSKIVDRICMDNPNLFHNLEPMENSIETVKKLFDHFEVYFLSTPMWSVPESFSGKRIWIQKHFGEMAAKRLILTHRKDLNIGDYLIDDRTRNGAGEFTGKHIHYGTKNFPNWETVYDYLIKSEDEKNFWYHDYPSIHRPSRHINDVDIASLFPWQQEGIPSGRMTEAIGGAPRTGRTDSAMAMQLAMQWLNENKTEEITQPVQLEQTPISDNFEIIKQMWDEIEIAPIARERLRNLNNPNDEV